MGDETMDDETLDRLRSRLDELVDRIDRHAAVVDAIDADPGEYDAEDVDAYLAALDSSLSDLGFLDEADAAIDPLESAAEAVEAEYLEGARVLVDDHEIEDAELADYDPPHAALLVPSPQVNQIRGGAQRLEMPDGTSHAFAIEQTLIEDVAEDKSGYLKLVLELRD